MPDVLVLAAVASQSQEDGFQHIFHLQQEAVGAFDAVCLMEQGRGRKLVTEEPKPIRSVSITCTSSVIYSKITLQLEKTAIMIHAIHSRTLLKD